MREKELITDFQRHQENLTAAGIDLWLGQSLDTSKLHERIPEYQFLPILTSVGCAFRRPSSILPKFDGRLRERLGARGKVMVDSGGFVLMKHSTMQWSVGDVSKIYGKIDAEHLVSLDHPPFPGDDKEVRSQKYAFNMECLRTLFDEFGYRIVPVIHGVNQEELQSNAKEIQALAPTPPVVAVGGLVPHLTRSGHVRKATPDSPQARIKLSIDTAIEAFPDSVVHVFGVGSAKTALGVIALGASSVDSISWRQAAGHGIVFIPGRAQRLLTNKPSKRPSRPTVSDIDKDILLQCRCPVCVGARERGNAIDELAGSYLPRALHNIYVLNKEVSDMVSARKDGRCEEFLSKRLSQAWCDVVFSAEKSATGMAPLQECNGCSQEPQ